MFESLHNIIIKGEHFSNETHLNGAVERKINIIYGRNGSGKSTIARALAEYSNPDIPAETRKFDKIGFDLAISEDSRRSIHVFNEEFIEKHVKIEDDSLGAIVMLGDQIDVVSQIDLKQEEIKKAQEELDSLGDLNKQLLDPGNASSPIFQFDSLKKKLSSPGEWAEKDAKCREHANKRNSPITETTIDAFASILTTNTLTDEDYSVKHKEFEDGYKVLLRTTEATEIQFNDIIYNLPVKIDKLQEILCKKVEKPQLSERDLLIIKIAKGDTTHLNQSRSVFQSSDIQYCPHCFRPITEKEKVDICTSIKNILNRDVEDYTSMLSGIIEKLVTLPYQFSGIEHLFREECNAFKLSVKNYNDAIERCQQVLQDRKTNVFEDYRFDIHDLNLSSLLEQVNIKFQELRSKVLAYNSLIKDRSSKAAGLNSLNKILAANKFKTDIDSYLQAKQNLANNNSQIQAKTERLKSLQAELATLNQSLEETHLALEFINV